MNLAGRALGASLDPSSLWTRSTIRKSYLRESCIIDQNRGLGLPEDGICSARRGPLIDYPRGRMINPVIDSNKRLV